MTLKVLWKCKLVLFQHLCSHTVIRSRSICNTLSNFNSHLGKLRVNHHCHILNDYADLFRSAGNKHKPKSIATKHARVQVNIRQTLQKSCVVFLRYFTKFHKVHTVIVYHVVWTFYKQCLDIIPDTEQSLQPVCLMTYVTPGQYQSEQLLKWHWYTQFIPVLINYIQQCFFYFLFFIFLFCFPWTCALIFTNIFSLLMHY